MGNNKRQMLMKTVCVDEYYDITVLSVSEVNEVKHSSGKKTKLMVADVVKGKRGNAMILDPLLADKIVFEIPEGEDVTDMIQSKIIGYANTLAKAMGAKGDQLGDCYIGEINNDPNDNQWHISRTIDNYCHDSLIPQLNAEQKREYIQKQEISRRLHEQAVEDERKKMNENNLQMEYAMQSEKSERLYNPYLRKLSDSITPEGKKVQNYNGVNIQTGDIIRLRSINKIGKDENGTYLYTGFAANTSREDDMISLNGGKPGNNYSAVCFTSSQSIEDILNRGDPYEIRNLLAAFSNENIYMNSSMQYIGSIDGRETQYTPTLASAINSEIGRYNSRINDGIQNAQYNEYDERE